MTDDLRLDPAGGAVPYGPPVAGAVRAPILAGLCLATAAYSVLQSLVVPALGVFRSELGTTPSGAAWILTAFLLSASVSTPLLGRLADLYGKRRVLLVALAAMSLGCTVSAAADGLGLAISLSGTYGWTAPRVVLPGLAAPVAAALWLRSQRLAAQPGPGRAGVRGAGGPASDGPADQRPSHHHRREVRPVHTGRRRQRLPRPLHRPVPPPHLRRGPQRAAGGAPRIRPGGGRRRPALTRQSVMTTTPGGASISSTVRSAAWSIWIRGSAGMSRS